MGGKIDGSLLAQDLETKKERVVLMRSAHVREIDGVWAQAHKESNDRSLLLLNEIMRNQHPRVRGVDFK